MSKKLLKEIRDIKNLMEYMDNSSSISNESMSNSGDDLSYVTSYNLDSMAKGIGSAIADEYGEIIRSKFPSREHLMLSIDRGELNSLLEEIKDIIKESMLKELGVK